MTFYWKLPCATPLICSHKGAHDFLAYFILYTKTLFASLQVSTIITVKWTPFSLATAHCPVPELALPSKYRPDHVHPASTTAWFTQPHSILVLSAQEMASLFSTTMWFPCTPHSLLVVLNKPLKEVGWGSEDNDLSFLNNLKASITLKYTYFLLLLFRCMVNAVT